MCAQFRSPADLESLAKSDGFCLLESNWDKQNESQAYAEPVGYAYASSKGSVLVWHGEERSFSNPLSAAQALFDQSQNRADCVGYFGYEFLHEFEKVPFSSAQQRLPLYFFYAYERPAIRLTYVCKDLKITTDLARLEYDLAKYSNFSKSRYLQAVEAIREHIRDGLVYQVNLSQQFRLPFTDSAFAYYLKLRALTRSAYSGFLAIQKTDLSPAFHIACASPELFLDKSEKHLSSSPIKGTIARCSDPIFDEQALQTLASSAKDQAELAMIVDLIRNDMNRVAEIGSVRVDAHAKSISLPYVHHLVSDLSCQLRDNQKILDILRALFPCGSVTGAPKIASMKFISELEAATREVYTGAIGLVRRDGSFTLNVAIRTAYILGDTLTFNSGGGVVLDSEPLQEYLETLGKCRALYSAYFS